MDGDFDWHGLKTSGIHSGHPLGEYYIKGKKGYVQSGYDWLEFDIDDLKKKKNISKKLFNFNAFFDKFKKDASIQEPQTNAAGEKIISVQSDSAETLDEIKRYLKESDVNFVENKVDKKRLLVLLGKSTPENSKKKSRQELLKSLKESVGN